MSRIYWRPKDIPHERICLFHLKGAGTFTGTPSDKSVTRVHLHRFSPVCLPFPSSISFFALSLCHPCYLLISDLISHFSGLFV